MNDYEEISLQEIFGMLWKNIYFIITFLIAGLLIGILISFSQVLQNPVEYHYTAKATIALSNGGNMSNQPQTVLHVIKSTSILDDAKNELGISGGNFVVSTSEGSKPNQYDILVEGPGKNQVISLVDELVSRGRNTVSGSMTMARNAVVENGHLTGNPIQVSKNVNTTLNVAISIVLAGMTAVLLVFLIRYMSGKVYSKNEVERLLDTKVLTTISNNRRQNPLAKFFKVR